MSETEVVALIAVGGTLGSGVLSYLAARRSTNVQLKGINAEMQRLRATHAEESRRERQEAYYAFVTAIHAVTQFVFGMRGPVTEDAYVDLVKKFGDGHITIKFLGTDDVIAATNDMVGVFGKFATAAAEAEDSEPAEERLMAAYRPVSAEWARCEMRLITAMKQDIAAARLAELQAP